MGESPHLRDQKQIIKGDVGGIVFRADTTNYTFYYFFVTQNGDYGLLLCPPGNTCRNIVASTFSSAIHQGLGQTNVIAVVAQGSMITLYVNNQKIASVTDNTYSHRQVGVVAAPSATNGHLTEVAYNNAKVWTL